MKNTNRIKCVDCTRAICMLYIIGVWHFQEYLIDVNFTGNIFESITNGVLGAFTFISAYFLGKKTISNKNDIICFFKKRIIRLYPLFFLSATTFLIIHYIWGANFICDFKQYILTLLGLSTIITPAPMTIWFVSMLILFYAITPFANMCKNLFHKALCCLCFFVILLLLHQFDMVDNRVILLFPVYAIGLIASGNINITDKFNPIIALISLISIIATHFLQSWLDLYFVLDFLSVFSITIFAIQIGKILSYNHIVSSIFIFISYGSMVAYLFHRQCFGVIIHFTGKLTPFLGYCCVLPLLIAISFFVQKYYDNIVFKITEKNNI